MGDGEAPGPGWGVEGTRPGAENGPTALWRKPKKIRP